MSVRNALIGWMILLVSSAAVAQHAGHASPSPSPTPMEGSGPKSDQPPMMPGPAGEHQNPDMMAAMETMEPMDHWMTMLHGYAFLTANRQGGPSGNREFESQNHLMVMAIRRAWGGKLSLLGTFTLEPATIPVQGSAELFERGETYQNVLLVDRQHPHDLFVQLAAAWETELARSTKIRLYLAPVGEPALGPVPYPHRLSASENPSAPLSHHNHDSTHISYDVASAAVVAGPATFEASAFHGQEPDENRWNIEAGAIDSYSGRLTVRPIPDLAFQISSGHLEHPEAIEEGNQTRSTASITYQKATPRGFIAVSAISGRNKTPEGPEWGNLFEWTWKFADSNFVYGRIESVDRDLYELTFKRQRPAGTPRARTMVQAGTIGYVRDVPLLSEAETGVGGDLGVYRFNSRLDPVYSRHPVSFHVFFRIRFSAPKMSHSGHMQMAGGF